jgi:hypothetical protein
MRRMSNSQVKEFVFERDRSEMINAHGVQKGTCRPELESTDIYTNMKPYAGLLQQFLAGSGRNAFVAHTIWMGGKDIVEFNIVVTHTNFHTFSDETTPEKGCIQIF